MQTPFTAAPHDIVLVLLVQIVALLVTARVLGEVAQRFKLPAVVGEILAGIVLGPSVLPRFQTSITYFKQYLRPLFSPYTRACEFGL
jgi:NhaP-type Na+/H+ or K+/H+ antiporter